ncbi:hypothetical protein EZV62_017382 [Acer yangbiense]|uniref:Jacalin-type lectin domain-containing protein n=1 Tax=Acer yangbiense TaxID=1000413 RepID=A0A5C7HGW4_9ROSI|nr:hypothetical protein EZV62_017382 [Acer yangbiense]
MLIENGSSADSLLGFLFFHEFFLLVEKYEDTIRECTKALELNSKYMKALVKRGEAYEKCEKLEEAIADMKKILDNLKVVKDPNTGSYSISFQLIIINFFNNDNNIVYVDFDRRSGEYFSLICGTTLDYFGMFVIESLTFHTNMSKYGPFGLMTGFAFEIPMEKGEIVGLFGCAGD